MVNNLIKKVENVEVKTGTHWSDREECPKCPVLHICKGACFFLTGSLWELTCDNAYSDAIAIFALAIEKITNGYIPVTIKGEGLPLERQDIFGTVYQHEDKKKQRIIPIKVISEKNIKVNDIEVYGKTRIES